METLINEKTITRPPWRDVLADNSLSPEYGPRTESEFLRLQKEHKNSVMGGGLWDFTREPRRARARTRLAKKREEAVLIMAWVQVHHAEIPDRELEAAYAVWRDGCSPNQAAKRMSTERQPVERRTVRTWNKRTQERMRRGLYE